MKKPYFLLFAIMLMAAFSLNAQTVLTYSNPGTYSFTVPGGITEITVECWGAGGGGGRSTSDNTGRGGGGGGAYATKTFVVIPGEMYSLTVGAGGSGGNLTALQNSGGSSFFGANVVLASGGGGVGNNSSTAGLGGVDTDCIGDIVFSGGNGADGSGGNSGAGGGGAGTTENGGNANAMIAGQGGIMLGGNGGDGRSSAGSGNVGFAYGGGGGGGRKGGFLSSNQNGGAGASGTIIITFTLPECNGIPTSGTAIASSPSGCSNTNFTLSSENYTYAEGMVYTWEYSDNGIDNWQLLYETTNPYATEYVTNTQHTIYYRFVTFCTQSNETNYSNVVSYQVNCINIPSTGYLSTCSAAFYDSGGTVADYGNNQNHSFTFYPETSGNKIRIEFTAFNIQDNFDGLLIYNGPDNTYPLLSSGLGAGTNASTCPAGSWRGSSLPPALTSSHSSGALTFVFTSDNTTTAPGWSASITCANTPDDPAELISNSPQCAQVLISPLGVAPAGEIWYWQTSPYGQSTANSDDEFIATVSGTYYLRSYRIADGEWSNAVETTVLVIPDIPEIPSAIAGNVSPEIGSLQQYSVIPVDNVSYNWVLPDGWEIQSGQGTHLIAAIAAETNGNISVTPSNICGIGSASTVATQLPAYRAIITSVDYGSNEWCTGETREVTVSVKNNGTAIRYLQHPTFLLNHCPPICLPATM